MRKGHRSIDVESDSTTAIDLLLVGYAGNNEEDIVNSVVRDIFEDGDGQLFIEWMKVNRCGNYVADTLAKSNHYGLDNFVMGFFF